MMNNSIHLLLAEIEQEIQWGQSDDWTTRDFESLSDRIFAKTEQRLSVTTLKRVWGRVQATGTPSYVTLNILAQFAGYKNWRSFQDLYKEKNAKAFKFSSNTIFLSAVLCGILAIAFWYIAQPETPEESRIHQKVFDEVDFSFEKMTTGYPNTVVFRYDVGDLSFDSLFIQQSWDETKRIDLEISKGLVTATYYFPGYFSTKLVLDGQIIKEKDLYIPTDGWQAILVSADGPYRYLEGESLQKDSSLMVDPRILDELNQNAPVGISLNHLTREPGLSSTDFTLEGTFRLASPTDRALCNYFWVTVIGTKQVVRVAFSDIGCVGDIALILDGKMISGKHHDLSAFGVAPSQWVDYRLELRDQKISIFVNGKEAFRHPHTRDMGQVGGVKCYFEGLPEVKKMVLSDREKSLDLLNLK